MNVDEDVNYPDKYFISCKAIVVKEMVGLALSSSNIALQESSLLDICSWPEKKLSSLP